MACAAVARERLNPRLVLARPEHRVGLRLVRLASLNREAAIVDQALALLTADHGALGLSSVTGSRAAGTISANGCCIGDGRAGAAGRGASSRKSVDIFAGGAAGRSCISSAMPR